MWTEEQLRAQAAKVQAEMNALGTKISGYDSEINRLSSLKNQDLQELLRLDGEMRALKRQLGEEVK
jgi:prefoldin subunit 5